MLGLWWSNRRGNVAQAIQDGNVGLSLVLGLCAIICALVVACLMIILLNWSCLNDLKGSIEQSISSSSLPIFNMASDIGYGSVIVSLAGITGSASGALNIALNSMGDTYVQFT